MLYSSSLSALPECLAFVKCSCAASTDPFCIAAQVSGTVEKDGVPMKGLKLKGKWDTELVAEMPDGFSRRLWTINPPAADPTRCGTHASATCGILGIAPHLLQ